MVEDRARAVLEQEDLVPARHSYGHKLKQGEKRRGEERGNETAGEKDAEETKVGEKNDSAASHEEDAEPAGGHDERRG